MRIVLACLVVLATSVGGSGRAPAQQYAAVGIGTASCATWAITRRNGDATHYEQWVAGFYSGADFVGKASSSKPLPQTDANGVWVWMDNYCQSHPVETIAGAMAEFVNAHLR
jgi:hypothetical protein